ncbi:MAG: ferritin-like domain-containing protein [Anaerolineae bacterium]
MTGSEDVIALLNDDMKDEHGALILYLQHAYFLGEGEEACEIEQTARDEMRHFKWLAQAIVQLGGVPTLDRSEMELGGDLPMHWMARDVVAEDDAIAKYERHREAIADPKIVAMIDRILTDERAHRGVFSGLQAKFAATGRVGLLSPLSGTGGEPAPAADPGRPGAVIDYATRHEYTVALQYLFHSFMTPSHEASREWETIAVNEMQHLGWFAEYAGDLGIAPLLAHDPVEKGHLTTDMLQADITAEQSVSRHYSDAIGEFGGDESLAKLVGILERARDNEDWHVHMFELMLGHADVGEDPLQRPGIGPTQPTEPRETMFGEGEGAPGPAVGAKPASTKGTASERGKGQLTVGSLLE